MPSSLRGAASTGVQRDRKNKAVTIESRVRNFDMAQSPETVSKKTAPMITAEMTAETLTIF
jgi:hypothetical protein